MNVTNLHGHKAVMGVSQRCVESTVVGRRSLKVRQLQYKK